VPYETPPLGQTRQRGATQESATIALGHSVLEGSIPSPRRGESSVFVSSLSTERRRSSAPTRLEFEQQVRYLVEQPAALRSERCRPPSSALRLRPGLVA
jgi:hypothetical protein